MWSSIRYCPSIYVEELRKITDITSQNSWLSLNPGVLMIQLQYLAFDD